MSDFDAFLYSFRRVRVTGTHPCHHMSLGTSSAAEDASRTPSTHPASQAGSADLSELIETSIALQPSTTLEEAALAPQDLSETLEQANAASPVLPVRCSQLRQGQTFASREAFSEAVHALALSEGWKARISASLTEQTAHMTGRQPYVRLSCQASKWGKPCKLALKAHQERKGCW